jgi:hypothetical protein
MVVLLAFSGAACWWKGKDGEGEMEGERRNRRWEGQKRE